MNPHQHFVQQLVANIHCLQDCVGALQAENQNLRQEVQNLRQEVQKLQGSEQTLLAENQRLQQELQLNNKKAQAPEKSAPQMTSPALPVQVQVRGETGGCEKQFLDNVTKLLVGQGILLQAEDYKENSEHFLLLFCPVATHMAADISNTLKGLGGVSKALLVVLHHQPKGSELFFLNDQQQVRHPALVATVHACFSMQDGFYHCQANEDAVVSVAATMEQFVHMGN